MYQMPAIKRVRHIVKNFIPKCNPCTFYSIITVRNTDMQYAPITCRKDSSKNELDHIWLFNNYLGIFFFFCMLAIVLAVVHHDTRVSSTLRLYYYTSHALVQASLYSSMHRGVLQMQCLRVSRRCNCGFAVVTNSPLG
jgi:hypothetical protein